MLNQEDLSYSRVLGNFDFHISAQMTTDYETTITFCPGNHRAVCHAQLPTTGFLFFCSGTDADGYDQVHMFTEVDGGTAAYARSCITENLHKVHINTSPGSLKAFNGPDGSPIVSLLGTQRGKGMIFAFTTLKNGIVGEWVIVPVSLASTNWEIAVDASGKPFFIVHDPYQNHPSSLSVIDATGRISGINLPFDDVDVKDVKSVNFKELHGISLLVICTDFSGKKYLVAIDGGFLNAKLPAGQGYRPLYISEISLPGGFNPSSLAVHNTVDQEPEIYVCANCSDNPLLLREGTKIFKVDPVIAIDPFKKLYEWTITPVFDVQCEASNFIIGRQGSDVNVWFTGNFGEEGKWLMRSIILDKIPQPPIPLFLLRDDTACAAVVVHEPFTNNVDVFIDATEAFSDNVCIRHYWADAESSLWRSADIRIEDTAEEAEARDVMKCAVYLNVLDMQGNAPDELVLKVSATEETLVEINNINYRLLPGKWVDIATEDGSCAILTEANDIDSPVYLVTLSEETDAIRIESSYFTAIKLGETEFEGLEGVNKGEGASYKEIVKQSTQQAAEITMLQPVDLVPANALLTATKKTNRRQRKEVKPKFVFACAFENDKSKVFKTEKAFNQYQSKRPQLLQLSLKKVFKTMVNAVAKGATAVGDAINSTAHFVKDATSVVIQKIGNAVKFIIEIGGELIHFIAETFEQCWSAMSVVLKKIWSTLKQAFKYICYVFNWHDTKLIMDALQGLNKTGLQYGIEELGTSGSETRKKIDNTFSKAEQLTSKKINGSNDVQEDNVEHGNRLYKLFFRSREFHFLNHLMRRSKDKLSKLLDVEYEDDFASCFVGHESKSENFSNIGLNMLASGGVGALNLVRDPYKMVNAVIGDVNEVIKIVHGGINAAMDKVGVICTKLRDDLNKPAKASLMARLHLDIIGTDTMTRSSLCAMIQAIPVHFIYKKLLEDKGEIFNEGLMREIAEADDNAKLETVFESTSPLAGTNNNRTNLKSIPGALKRLLHCQLFTLSLKSIKEIRNCISAKRKKGLKGKKGELGKLDILNVLRTAVMGYRSINSKLKSVNDLHDSALNLKIETIGSASALLSMLNIARKSQKVLNNEKQVYLLASVSAVAGLLPLVICSTNALRSNLNAWDYCDLTWKFMNGVNQACTFLLATENKEVFYVALGATGAGIIFMFMDNYCEDHKRLCN